MAGVGGNGRLVLLLVAVVVVVVVGGVAGNRRSTEDGLLMDRGGEMREEDEGRETVDADDELCCLLALCALVTLISSILALALFAIILTMLLMSCQHFSCIGDYRSLLGCKKMLLCAHSLLQWMLIQYPVLWVRELTCSDLDDISDTVAIVGVCYKCGIARISI